MQFLILTLRKTRTRSEDTGTFGDTETLRETILSWSPNGPVMFTARSKNKKVAN